MNVIQNLLPTSKYKLKSPYTMVADSIVVQDWIYDSVLLYQKGYSTRQIADKVGKGKTLIARTLKNMNIKKGEPEWIQRMVTDYLNETYTIIELAVKYDKSTPTIIKYLRDKNVYAKKSIDWNVKKCQRYCKSVGGDFLSERYTFNYAKYKFLCSECGQAFERMWGVYYYTCNHVCPDCSGRLSKGEEAIKNILEMYDVKYIREYVFDECINDKTGYALPFDFYVPDRGVLIEYDGQQHYHSIDIWGGEDGLTNQIYRDSIKTKFALDNGYILIRIPYWDFENIEEIIYENLIRGDVNDIQNSTEKFSQ